MIPRMPRLLIATSVLLAMAACTPGSSASSSPSSTPTAPTSVSTDPASMGDITLVIWDQEVRGGQAAQMKQLNAEFQKKYPNIKIKRVSRSFDDLKTTLRLALSGNEPPDVVEANNGRSDMGEFVRAGELVSLDPYAKAYGWPERFPPSILQYSMYSPDGKVFGDGNLYGLPQVGEVVGVFYNAKKLAALGLEVPKTWDDFQAAMAKAKAAGEIPMQFGNLDQWPGIHEFGTVQGRTTAPDVIRDLAFGQPGASWPTPENTQAAQTLVDWVDKGYFEKGFNGKGYDPAWQDFSKGQGVFLIAGTWLLADLQKAMGADVGFMLPPPPSADATPVATGGTGLPFAVTAKSEHPDAGAAYIDFITSEHAMEVLAKTGNLPIVGAAKQPVQSDLQKDVFTAFGTVVDANGLVPYLDYATPTMYATLGAAVQDLLAKQQTPEQFVKTLQADYGAFLEKNG